MRSRSLENLSRVLHTCRKDQASREGREKFWKTFVSAIEGGFEYFEEMMAYSTSKDLQVAHQSLKQWASINKEKFESLLARDRDYVCRVDNLSDIASIHLF